MITKDQPIDEIPLNRAKFSDSEGWKMVKLGDIAYEVSDRVENPSESELERFVGLEHLESGSFIIRQWGNTADVTSAMKLFQSGDTLFARRNAYLKRASMAIFDGICSGDAIVLREKQEMIVKGFLPFILNTDELWNYAIANAAGSMSKRVKWHNLAAYEFALPPKDEQRRIADNLWAADEMYRKRSHVLSPISILRQILIDKLMIIFAQNSDCMVQLGAVCEMQNGRSFPSEEYSDKGIHLLRPGNLDKSGYIVWSDENTKFLPQIYQSLASEYLINPGDIVINLTAQSLEDGFMGRVCIARKEDICLLNQRIGRFVCNECILPEYLYRCLQTTSFRKLVESSCEGSKIKHLYWRHIENFPIPLPSLKEQKLMVQVLAAMDSSRESAEKSLTNAKLLCKLLREKLLSGN